MRWQAQLHWYGYTQARNTMHKHVYGSNDRYSKDYCTHTQPQWYEAISIHWKTNWSELREDKMGSTNLLLGLAFRCGRAAVTISLSLIAVLTLKHQPVRECTAVTLGAGWREEGDEEGEKDWINTCTKWKWGWRNPCIATQHQSHFNLHIVGTEVKTACMALHMLHIHTTRNLWPTLYNCRPFWSCHL